jgi:hypothetical protein
VVISVWGQIEVEVRWGWIELEEMIEIGSLSTSVVRVLYIPLILVCSNNIDGDKAERPFPRGMFFHRAVVFFNLIDRRRVNRRPKETDSSS